MPDWTTYNGIDVPTDTPTGEAGVKLKDNFVLIGNRLGPFYATVASVTDLPANTYDNGSSGEGAFLEATTDGVLTVDGHNVAKDDVIVVNFERSNLAHNGIYVVTTPGDVSNRWVLTRHPNLCTADQFGLGALAIVGNSGTSIKNTILSCQPVSPITVGTTAITFGWSETGGYVSGIYAHAEGKGTSSENYFSHAEGLGTTASGYCSHVEGLDSLASGFGSHAEGWECDATYTCGHAEGRATLASGLASHAEGILTLATGDFSHAGGSHTTASGYYSHAGGYEAIASLRGSWARANGKFATRGDAQELSVVLRQQTTTNTAMNLTLDGNNTINAGNALVIPIDQVCMIDLYVVARKSDGSDYAMFQRRCLVANASGTITVLDTQPIGTDKGTGGGSTHPVPTSWVLSDPTPDITNHAITIQVNGPASTTINWVCKAQIVTVG